MYDTILVPTDGSDHSVRAAEHAVGLAGAFDAAVHLLNVVDLRTAGGPFAAGGADEEFLERCRDDAQETIDETVERVDVDDDVDVRAAVVEGPPSERIVEYAADNGADLIAMGTHGRSGLNRLIAGSVTERVVRLADAPVLTVRATERSAAGDGYDRILVPTDGSDCAAAAVDHALAIGAAYDATIHALNVVDVGAIAAASDIAPPAGALEQLENQGREATDEVAERAQEAGLDAVTAVREGFPARTLLAYADDHDIDLTAMGTHGRTGVDRVMLGSTAAKAIRHAETPVLTVREPEGDAA